MKILYVGQLDAGSTSLMRFSIIKLVLGCEDADSIDISVPILSTPQLMRSIGWRYNIGPLIRNINDYVLSNLSHKYYDMIWVDKAKFITPYTAKTLRKKTNTLIHFTPDPAFLYHRSHLFYNHINLYDLCVTTKSYEVQNYYDAGVRNLMLTTQGYDPSVHKSFTGTVKSGVCFLGHYEKERGEIIQKLLDNGVTVKLAGIKWGNFAIKNKNNSYLKYYGNGIYGDEYSQIISSSFIGLGFLSKWVPELHTTRTFEIPACGTALLTEANEETTRFFSHNEAIFFKNELEITELIKIHLNNIGKLTTIADRGTARVVSSGFDYRSIVESILKRANIYEC